MRKLIVAFRNFAKEPETWWKWFRIRAKSVVWNGQCRPSGTNELILAGVLRRIVGKSATCMSSPGLLVGTSSHLNIIPLKQKATEHRQLMFCRHYCPDADTRCTATKLAELRTSRWACLKGGRGSYTLPTPVCWIPMSQTRLRLDCVTDGPPDKCRCQNVVKEPNTTKHCAKRSQGPPILSSWWWR